MHELAASDFLATTGSHGLKVSAKYAHNWPRNLSFEQPTAVGVYWTPPTNQTELKAFLRTLLELLGDWNTLYLWPKCVPLKDVLLDEEIDALTDLANSTPVLATTGAIVVVRSEIEPLLGILVPLIEHGWSWPTDVHLVPDSFAVCVIVDHHEAVHVNFPTPECCGAFVAAMESRGFPLPEKPPDWTFRSNPDGSPVPRS